MAHGPDEDEFSPPLTVQESSRATAAPRRWLAVVGIALVSLLIALLNCAGPGRHEPALPPSIPNAVYVGSTACLECHQDQANQLAGTLHGKILLTPAARTDLQRQGCESCHGPGSQHVSDPADYEHNIIRLGQSSPHPPSNRNAVCLQCHTKGRRLFWQGSPHEMRDLSCTTCHAVHRPQATRAQLTAPSQLQLCGQCHAVKTAMAYNWAHMPVREGKLQCADCHNVHGTITEKLIPENSINENCYRCHADVRGPFLHEHPPVREDCRNCHVAHGSNNVRLLRTRAPRLCQQCHNESRHPSTAFSNLADIKVAGRACLGCHVNIHGSNHPSGFAFTR